jgi:hypothetical protein
MTIIAITACITMQAQNVAINNSAIAADASAILDVSSTSKGLLIPRMNTSAISSIVNPAKGLLVYDSVKNQLMVNMGTAAVSDWQTIVFKSGWGLTGNVGTNPFANFIGTTDNQPLKFKVNNTDAGSISSNGNLLLGYNSGNPSITGIGNTGIGEATLSSNTTGESNTAIGSGSLISNSTGSYNTASGAGSLTLNETGTGNTANGYYSLIYNTAGNANTASGYSSLSNNETGNDNTAHGYSSLYNNTTGNYNTATGHSSLLNNTTGIGNTANGYFSLAYNTTGNNNTATGRISLSGNTTGNNNTANGFGSLGNNSSGYSNAAFGPMHYTGIPTAITWLQLVIRHYTIMGLEHLLHKLFSIPPSVQRVYFPLQQDTVIQLPGGILFMKIYQALIILQTVLELFLEIPQVTITPQWAWVLLHLIL